MRDLSKVLEEVLLHIPFTEEKERNCILYYIECIADYPPELHLDYWKQCHEHFSFLVKTYPDDIYWKREAWDIWLGRTKS